MRVLVAFDKFKDALSADAAGEVVAATLREQHPDWAIDLCPLSDGGEGFAATLTRAADGEWHRPKVTGPRGATVDAALGFVAAHKLPAAARRQLGEPCANSNAARIAVLDLASASGLALLAEPERDPWHTSTGGTGELIRAAAARQPAAILVGIGGSATNDLGLGALAALGLRAVDAAGHIVTPPTPQRWPAIAGFAGVVDPALPPILVACDVTNPLLGPAGCAAVYGPQKGLAAVDLAHIERESARLARLLCAHTGRPLALTDTPGAGAAGGFAFGLMAGAGARLLPGFALVAAWLDLDRRIAAADLVLTGEGRFDETSLAGKGPGAILARARQLGRETHVFAGSVAPAFAASAPLHAISPPEWPLAQARAATPELLRAAVRRVLP